MKIAVYGDSFAQPVEFGYKGNDFLWCNTLANKLNGSIDNFAKTGTSIFYSYQQVVDKYILILCNFFRFFSYIYKRLVLMTHKLSLLSRGFESLRFH